MKNITYIILWIVLAAVVIFSYFTNDPLHMIFIIAATLFIAVLFTIEYIKQRAEQKKRMKKIEKLKAFGEPSKWD